MVSGAALGKTAPFYRLAKDMRLALHDPVTAAAERYQYLCHTYGTQQCGRGRASPVGVMLAVLLPEEFGRERAAADEWSRRKRCAVGAVRRFWADIRSK